MLYLAQTSSRLQGPLSCSFLIVTHISRILTSALIPEFLNSGAGKLGCTKSSLPPVFHLACELSIALMFLNSCINQAEDCMPCEDYIKFSVSKNKGLVTLIHFCII